MYIGIQPISPQHTLNLKVEKPFSRTKNIYCLFARKQKNPEIARNLNSNWASPESIFRTDTLLPNCDETNN